MKCGRGSKERKRLHLEFSDGIFVTTKMDGWTAYGKKVLSVYFSSYVHRGHP